MADALDHLQGLGHREIALVTARQALPEYGPKVRSEAAYRRLCSERGLRKFLFECEATVAAGREIRLPSETTAVIFLNEFACFGLLARLAAEGVVVPDELSVLSFGSPALAPLADPVLTIMRAPGASLGGLGVDALIDRLENPAVTPPPQLRPYVLELGGSTATCRS
jgi:DNA-binding LacI/PurR family transcriptional regulator